jgi:hypothetical protein
MRVSKMSEGIGYNQRTSPENLAMLGYGKSDGVVPDATACIEY